MQAGRTMFTWAAALALGLTSGAARGQEITEPLTAGERQALIDFYTALDGDNWVNHSGWKDAQGEFSPPGTEDTWYGVDLGWVGESMPGEPPSVTHLAMSDNHLSGPIDELLEPFTNLVSVTFLREPGLTGQLPNLLGHPYLVNLAFVECGLSGGLPTTAEGHVALPLHLQGLDLRGCALSLDWSQLLTMVCRDDLQTLDLQDIPLGGTLPDLRAEFPSLWRLDLQNTGIAGPLPAQLPEHITQLDLSANALLGPIPPAWGEAEDLQILWLQGNRLSGELPLSLLNLTNLAPSGGLNFNFNALETNDNGLWSFLVDKCGPVTLPDGTFLGDWRERQTTRPAQVTAWPTGDGHLRVSWTDAPNAWQDGFYRIEQSPDGESWTPLAETQDRSQTELLVTFDERRLRHHFRVATVSRPFSQNANEVASLPRAGVYSHALFYDDFEEPQAWSLSGDFAIGAPLPGNGAAQAWSGTAVLGSNLAGAHADNQGPAEAEAITPSFSCAGKSHVKLAFRSCSQFDGFSGDLGSVDVSVGGGPWQNLEVLNHFAEDGWDRHWVDLSPYVDNQSQVRVRFAYTSDGSFGLDGWNLDEVAVVARPTVSGIFTVDPAGTLGSNFATLDDAFAYFNSVDLAGPVVVEVVAGAEFEEDLEPLFVKGSQDRSLTFLRSGAGANPLLRSAGGAGYHDAVLKLRGADWVAFEGIDVEAGEQVEHAVQLLNRAGDDGCAHVSLRDLAVRGGRLAGVFSGTMFQPLADSGANSHLSLERLTVDGSATAVLLDNNWSNEHMDVDNLIRDCVLGTAAEGLGSLEELGSGVRVQGQNGLRVEGCEVAHVRGFMATGLDLLGANLHVAGNRIHSLDGGWRVTGIRAQGAKLYNNMVALADSSTGAEIIGIALEDGYNSFCDFNSVRVEGGAQSTTDCLHLPESAPARVSNNILVNLTPDQEAGWHHAAISVVGTPYFTSSGSVCDANLFHVPSATGGGVGFDRYIQQPLVDLAAWRSTSGEDQISHVGDPRFASETDLHLRNDQPTPAEAAGLWLQGVENYPWLAADLDGEPRNPAQPDIGADEGDFAIPSELPWEPYALSPQPGESAVDLRPELKISWSWDNTHPVLWTEFYLGTDSSAVAACNASVRVLADGTAQSRWTPATPLSETTRYFWQARTGNWSGSTPGGVWSFTTAGVVAQFPFCESFDESVPPAGWTSRLNQAFDGGLNGANLQPTWGMGWSLTTDPSFVQEGNGAAYISSWMMPAYYWLLTPALRLPEGGELSFRLRFEHSEGQPTALHLLCDDGSGWSLLRSWDGPEDACDLAVTQTVSLPGGANQRLAFVYDASAQGTPVAVDALCVTAGSFAHQSPELTIKLLPDGQARLDWTAVPGALGYRVYTTTDLTEPVDWSPLFDVPAASPTLDVPTVSAKRFYQVRALD
ncbi:MAG: hypothetical protein WC326_13580 [Candidatus Delongbacteria bacterium]